MSWTEDQFREALRDAAEQARPRAGAEARLVARMHARRRRKRTVGAALGLAAAATVAALAVVIARAPETEPGGVSGVPPTAGFSPTGSRQANGPTYSTALSADGRWVAFASLASNLVPGDTNVVSDVFAHDMVTGNTVRVSVSSAGIQANGPSARPAITADGRFVSFTSTASNLVAGDDNRCERRGVAGPCADVFVRDLVRGSTRRISLSSAGGQADGYSDFSSISADGRYVAFVSRAANLVRGDTNGRSDVFVRDTRTGETSRVSVSSAGVQGEFESGGAAISGDGRAVAFLSASNNLDHGKGRALEIYVHDRDSGSTERISEGRGRARGAPSMSADGRFVAFSDGGAIVVYDRQFERSALVSVPSSDRRANGLSDSPAISGDGRAVAFRSDATNLVLADTNRVGDIFVRDLVLGRTERVSMSADEAQANARSFAPSLSADGRLVAFRSLASNLVSGDTNGASDAFVRDRTAGTTRRASLAAFVS